MHVSRLVDRVQLLTVHYTIIHKLLQSVRLVCLYISASNQTTLSWSFLVILYYDHLMTLSEEITRIWSRPRARSSLLFFIHRYVPLVGHIVVLVYTFGKFPISDKVSATSVSLFATLCDWFFLNSYPIQEVCRPLSNNRFSLDSALQAARNTRYSMTFWLCSIKRSWPVSRYTLTYWQRLSEYHSVSVVAHVCVFREVAPHLDSAISDTDYSTILCFCELCPIYTSDQAWYGEYFGMNSGTQSKHNSYEAVSWCMAATVACRLKGLSVIAPVRCVVSHWRLTWSLVQCVSGQ